MSVCAAMRGGGRRACGDCRGRRAYGGRRVGVGGCVPPVRRRACSVGRILGVASAARTRWGVVVVTPWSGCVALAPAAGRRA